jgi:hypothetical protein
MGEDIDENHQGEILLEFSSLEGDHNVPAPLALRAARLLDGKLGRCDLATRVTLQRYLVAALGVNYEAIASDTFKDKSCSSTGAQRIDAIAKTLLGLETNTVLAWWPIAMAMLRLKETTSAGAPAAEGKLITAALYNMYIDHKKKKEPSGIIGHHTLDKIGSAANWLAREQQYLVYGTGPGNPLTADGTASRERDNTRRGATARCRALNVDNARHITRITSTNQRHTLAHQFWSGENARDAYAKLRLGASWSLCHQMLLRGNTVRDARFCDLGYIDPFTTQYEPVPGCFERHKDQVRPSLMHLITLSDSTNKADDGTKIRQHCAAAHRDVLQCAQVYVAFTLLALHHLVGQHEETILQEGKEFNVPLDGVDIPPVELGKPAYYDWYLLGNPEDMTQPFTAKAQGGGTRRAMDEAAIHSVCSTHHGRKMMALQLALMFNASEEAIAKVGGWAKPDHKNQRYSFLAQGDLYAMLAYHRRLAWLEVQQLALCSRPTGQPASGLLR